MISSLILPLVYRKMHPEKMLIQTHNLSLTARVILMLFLTATAYTVFSQERSLQYIIKRSGRTVGNLIVKENKEGNRVTYRLQSAVKTSFVFSILVWAIEEAVYEDGVLTYSHFYQKINSSEHVNTEIQASSKTYVVSSGSDIKSLHTYPITYNLVCLYTLEPLHRAYVFADKFQRFLPIVSLRPHHYKIKFPDGNENE